MKLEDLIGKITCADCLEVMPTIPDKSVDMILCDLPYGTTACKWDTIIPFDKLWEQYKRIIKDDGAIVLFGSEPFSSKLRMSNLNWYKYDWIWDKITATGMTLAKYQPMKEHEIISVFGKGKIRYFPIMEEMNIIEKYKCYKKSNSSPLAHNDNINRFRDKKYPKSIINISNANHKDSLHPTQKPVKLFEYLIKTYTQENELVLDNCSGSGTTAVACHNLKRRFICIERDKEYCEASIKRLEEARKQLRFDL